MIGHATNRAQTWALFDFAQPSSSARPTHRCVYCGNPLFAPPRTSHVHCAKCYRHISVKDILLTGTIIHERFLTAGKITVAANAHVTAELVACHIELAGEVHGTVLASQSCSVQRTAKHVGTLLTRYLNIQFGAKLRSAIEIIRD